ncbi:Hypothetical predicted protein [Octopus vulgaris]|uniref:Uncharacterized protein n=1 Tax=Octopus vulgaris TaxID=6645 RepID=A0AA36BLX6_OCTVU|nr:Hypothetical predicted protein [Octopus vulgaris]
MKKTSERDALANGLVKFDLNIHRGMEKSSGLSTFLTVDYYSRDVAAISSTLIRTFYPMLYLLKHYQRITLEKSGVYDTVLCPKNVRFSVAMFIYQNQDDKRNLVSRLVVPDHIR